MAGGARICLGQIGAAHGLNGEVRLHSFTAAPEAIADYGPLETDDGRRVEIEDLRPAKKSFIARLCGITDRNAAAALTNAKLYVPRERLPEPEGPDEFYHADLVGLAVIDRSGTKLGSVVGIHNFGAGDLIEVRLDAGGPTQLLPFDVAAVPVVDVRGGKLVVAPSAEDRETPPPSRGRSTPKRSGGG
jgi:16S rRNA processing protein RimM